MNDKEDWQKKKYHRIWSSSVVYVISINLFQIICFFFMVRRWSFYGLLSNYGGIGWRFLVVIWTRMIFSFLTHRWFFSRRNDKSSNKTKTRHNQLLSFNITIINIIMFYHIYKRLSASQNNGIWLLLSLYALNLLIHLLIKYDTRSQ